MENGRNKVVWFEMNVIRSEGEGGKGGKVAEDRVKAITELIMEG